LVGCGILVSISKNCLFCLFDFFFHKKSTIAQITTPTAKRLIATEEATIAVNVSDLSVVALAALFAAAELVEWEGSPENGSSVVCTIQKLSKANPPKE